MSGAMAFLAGMGTGYLNGKKYNQEQERQDKIDKQRDELHTAKIDELNLAKSDRAAYKDAMTDTSVQAEQGPPTAEMVAATPAGQEPAPIGYLAGNGTSAKKFAEQGVAQDYANKFNAPEAQQIRASKLAAQGNAFANTQLTQTMQREAATGQLKEQKELQAAREFGRGLATAAATGGWKGAAQFSTEKYNDGNTYKAEEDGKGGAIVIAIGKDGNEIGRMPFKSMDEFIMYGVTKADPTKWIDYKTSRSDKEADQGNKDRDFDLRKKEAESTAAYRNRTLSIQAAQEGRARDLHKTVMAEANIPPAVKLQATSIAKQMESISASLNKAMAEDNFNPQSDNAKRLLESQAALGIQYENLLKSYIPNTGDAATGLPDASVFDKPAAAAPGATAAPAPAPRAAPPKPAAPQFNAAGYANVQSTIDGAKRGDARARALLLDLIKQGVTTPSERNQISAL